MDITITSTNKEGYLLIESKGSLFTKEDLIKHSEMVLAEIQKHSAKKILIYEPETNFPLELFPYFDLVKEYKESFPPEINQLKIAVVIAEAFKEIGATWETLCISRGFQYVAFTNLEDAEGWLR